MELLVQYLDDLEDLFYAFALKWERIRRAIRFALFMCISMSFQVLGVILALSNPPLAVAMAALLLVGLLYRAAVFYSPGSVIPA
jgi:membrane protein YdbS with pleckstrin-like domain